MKNTMKKPVAIPVEKLRPFAEHPFKVRDDDEMNTLIESIQTQGILSPLIVRPIENTDEYEVISGHRRLHAAQKAGITEVPALIYVLDRDAAAIAVVDSNLHREHILPSEKAFAYKLKADALKHQGQRTDITSEQIAPKLSTEVIGEQEGISKDTVKRYIRLTHLIPEFLEKMDKGEIALSVGVELSYLDESSQREVLEQCEMNDCTPSYSQAWRMHKADREGTLTTAVIQTIMSEEKSQPEGPPENPNGAHPKVFPAKLYRCPDRGRRGEALRAGLPPTNRPGAIRRCGLCLSRLPKKRPLRSPHKLSRTTACSFRSMLFAGLPGSFSPKYRRICSGMNKNCSDGSKAAPLPSVHLKIKIKIDMIGAKEESYERSDLCPLLIGSTAGRIH